MVSIANRTVTLAKEATLQALLRTLPRTNANTAQRAVSGVLDAPSIPFNVGRVAESVERSMRRQLTAIIGEKLPPVNINLNSWVTESVASIRRGIRAMVGPALTAASTEMKAKLDSGMSLWIYTDAGWKPGQAMSAGLAAAGGIFESRRGGVIQRVRAAVLRLTGLINRLVQEALGIETYKWMTRGDGRVRMMHRALNNTVQRWDRPPIISPDGRRGHPGDDYNCRCVAIPVV